MRLSVFYVADFILQIMKKMCFQGSIFKCGGVLGDAAWVLLAVIITAERVIVVNTEIKTG